jgi:hypothetical protein
MIIGNGSIALSFKKSKFDYSEYIIFASGVSDSTETKESEYTRELDLIKDTIDTYPNLTFIYFTSVLSSKKSNRYYQHKYDMEDFIVKNCKKWIIFSIPQVISFNGNKKNIINFFKNSILENKDLVIASGVYRSLLDVSDLVNIVEYCKDKTPNGYIHISGIEKQSIMYIVIEMSNILLKIPKIKEVVGDVDKQNWSFRNSEIVDSAIDILGIKQINYTKNVMKKYIGRDI